jgi:hypothetical protein
MAVQALFLFLMGYMDELATDIGTRSISNLETRLMEMDGTRVMLNTSDRDGLQVIGKSRS